MAGECVLNFYIATLKSVFLVNSLIAVQNQCASNVKLQVTIATIYDIYTIKHSKES